MNNTTPKRRGRPPVLKDGRMVTIYLPALHAENLKKLGGSLWVRKKIEDEINAFSRSSTEGSAKPAENENV